MTFSEKSISFQLTPSRRATLVPYNDFEEKVFQLTPSRRATINPAITLATTLFQLTPSRRATTLRKSGAWNCEDFNSRPHGGRLLIEREESCRYISTHALTEGDDSASSAELMILSFQLTPSRRATLSWRRCFRRMRYFNSRPHGGRPFVSRF